MRENGLLDNWRFRIQADARRCLDASATKAEKSRLSLKNLTGAFVVLFSGCIASILAFLFEKFSTVLKI